MKYLTLLLLLLPLPLLAGCGGSSGSSKAGTVEISLFTWTRPEELRVNQDLVRKFEEQNPGIKVKLINEPSDRAMEKLQASIAAKNAPDVMSIHGAFFIPMADKGALLDLEPLIKADPTFDLSDFYPQLVELCRHKGKLYSLPRYTSVYVLFYNKDHFDAVGLAYPDESWTWDTFRKAAQKLTINSPDPDKRRFGCAISFWEARIYPWVWANGGEVLDATRTHCTLNTPEAQEALQFLVDLRHKYKVAPPLTRAERRQVLGMFQSGKASMYMTGAWDIQALHDAPTLRWGVAPLPKQKARATLLGMENYAISATTEHPQEAWKLFKFLMSKEAQKVMADTLEKQPSRQSVANGPYLAAKAPYDRRVFVEALKYAHQAPNIPEWDAIRQHIEMQLDLIWAGQISVEAGTRKACEGVNKALARASS